MLDLHAYILYLLREERRNVFAVVQLLSHIRLFVTRWTVACQASLSFTISWSLPRIMSIEPMILSSHLILCRPPLLLPSIFPSIRVFSNEVANVLELQL